MDDEEPSGSKSSKGLFSEINDYYLNLLGYCPKETSLQKIHGKEWISFCISYQLPPDALGIYLPRNQTAIIPRDNELSLFHEYFGHGLYCEQSSLGKRLVSLDKKLREEEEKEFQNRNFAFEEIQKFREENETARELQKFKEENSGIYEGFAVWTEYFLSKEFGFIGKFEKKYDSLLKQDKEALDSIVNFSGQCGNLATFHAYGIEKTSNSQSEKIQVKGGKG